MGDGPGVEYLGYDFWWHITQDTLLTSEWARPTKSRRRHSRRTLARPIRSSVHVWDLRKRRHVQALELGKEYQMVLELRPAHDPPRHMDLRVWSSRSRI